MTEEQLETLKEYIDACIDDAVARSNDSEDQYQTSGSKYKLERRLHEVFIEPVPLNRRAV